jgi:hypothetical protein
MMPTSIGFTFTVAGVQALRIAATLGALLPPRPPGPGAGQQARRAPPRLAARAHGGVSPRSRSPLARSAPGRRRRKCPAVVVRGLVRRRDDEWSVTLYLTNGQSEPKAHAARKAATQPGSFSPNWKSAPSMTRRSSASICACAAAGRWSRKTWRWTWPIATRPSLPWATASPSTPTWRRAHRAAPCGSSRASCRPRSGAHDAAHPGRPARAGQRGAGHAGAGHAGRR